MVYFHAIVYPAGATGTVITPQNHSGWPTSRWMLCELGPTGHDSNHTQREI